MRFAPRLIIAATLATGAAGCSTQLVVNRVLPNAEPPAGVVYFLPLVEYEVKLVRQLVRCDDVDQNSADANLAVKTAATATTRYLQDPDHAYSIDYDKLSSALKKTDVTIELHENGTLKSVNASVTDETRQVIANVVSGVARLALISAGLPGAQLDDKGKPVDRNVCTPAARSALKSLKSLEAAIKAGQSAIEATETEIADSKEHPDKLKPLREKLKKLKDEQAANGKLRDKAVEFLTHTKLHHFRPKTDMRQAPLAPMPELLSKWFTEVGKATPEVAEAMTATVAVAGASQTGKAGNAVVNGDAFYYRQPADAILVVCPGTACLDAATKVLLLPEDKRLLSTPTVVPQLGVLARLAFENGAFESNILKATFRPSGMLEKLESSSKASATEASAAFKDSVEVLGKVKDQKRKEGLQQLGDDADRLKAEKARLDAELELEKSRKALDAFRSQQ